MDHVLCAAEAEWPWWWAPRTTKVSQMAAWAAGRSVSVTVIRTRARPA
jgi:hypothetical protein